jgi:hypothetical protein
MLSNASLDLGFNVARTHLYQPKGAPPRPLLLV